MDIIQLFNNYIQFEKRYSKHTVISYMNDICQFQQYIQTTFEETKLEKANHQMIRSWLASLMEEKNSARSVNRKISSLKSFYKFLLKNNIILQLPTAKIVSPKTSKKLPVFIDKNNLNELLDTEIFDDEKDAKRNKLIIELFYFTGIRLSELINLKRKNIDANQNTIKVLGKRNKERIIPITSNFSHQIVNYLQETSHTTSEYLFFNANNKKLNEKFVYRLVNSYLSKVSSVSKKSPHVLRHTFATQMLNNGADLNAIKEILGHASLSATEIYTHNTFEKLKNIHQLAHPRA
jgi:integrase/recombinase XerC